MTLASCDGWPSTLAVHARRAEGRQGLRTYSTYERGTDMLNVAYQYMDLVPKGRDEGEAALSEWLRRHDEYAD
jgi:predicted dithiol-disulfide oxidoreductase (DUF899 family)